MATFPIYKAKSRLSELIRLALSGEKVFISRGGNGPEIELVPTKRRRVVRALGTLASKKFKMAKDFDAPLDDFGDYSK
jgi:antitoxin (DNA-binding transcriptional repressor) of toxin-antitoxin stability system